jgi:type III secretory pathway component EscU
MRLWFSHALKSELKMFLPSDFFSFMFIYVNERFLRITVVFSQRCLGPVIPTSALGRPKR